MSQRVPSGKPGRGLTSTRWLGVSPLALIVSACVGTSGPGRADPFLSVERGEVQVHVRNQNFYDATITAISDTGRRKLGTVGGKQETVFTMPWAIVGGLRVEIDLLAGRECTTESIAVTPGDTVELQILAEFDRSSFCG